MQKEKYIKIQAVPVKRIDKAQAGLLKTNLEAVSYTHLTLPTT